MDMEARIAKLETNFEIFQKVHETRLEYLEKSVMRHMEDEEKNIQDIKRVLQDLDKKVGSSEHFIDNRIRACRNEMLDAHDQKFATRVELTTVSGDVKSNGRMLAALITFIGIAIAIINVVM